MDYFIGLDIGTSGVKAIAVALAGKVLATKTVAYPLSAPKPGWAEQDPDLWWHGTQKVLRLLLADPQLRHGHALSVGLSGQMHSSVFLDAQGDVIRPALLWCDGRTTKQCQTITKRVGEARLRNWVSNPALEGFTLPKILWLKENEPAAWRRLAKVVLAKDYIRYRLTGVLGTDYSDAAGTLLLDVKHRRWSGELLGALGLKRDLLVDLGESSQVIGNVSANAAKLTGLPLGVAVVAGGADNACGAIGVGAVKPGLAVASWGTSGTVLAPTAKPLVDPKMRAHTFCSAVPGQWYVMGVMLSAGGAFSWYRQNLAKGETDLSLNSEAAKIAPGSGGLSFLPYFQGERTPHRDASARGALVGLSLSHSRAHVSRALLEGICYGLRDSVEILKALKLPVKSVLLTGGGAKSPLLRRMQADIYGLPVHTVDKEEGPAFGAALLGAVGVVAFKSIEQACERTLRRSKAVAPDKKTHRAYALPYQRFKDLYPILKPTF